MPGKHGVEVGDGLLLLACRIGLCLWEQIKGQKVGIGSVSGLVAVIGDIGLSADFLLVETGNDVALGVNQAARGSPRTTEKIDRKKRGRLPLFRAASIWQGCNQLVLCVHRRISLMSCSEESVILLSVDYTGH